MVSVRAWASDTLSWMPVFMPCPPAGLWTCAASPQRSTLPFPTLFALRADGTMKMRQLTDGLPIPARGSVTLEPASYHLMFLDLKRPLTEGETFPGTLTFEKAGTIGVTFEVRGTGAGVPKHHGHQHL
jgi:Copper chaperone PCu(A)C